MSTTTVNGRRPLVQERHPDIAEDLVSFGVRVREHRKRLGLSQEKLAKLAGCERQSVNRIENTAYTPGLDRVLRLARALGVHSAVLLGGRPPKDLRPDNDTTGGVA